MDCSSVVRSFVGREDYYNLDFTNFEDNHFKDIMEACLDCSYLVVVDLEEDLDFTYLDCNYS